MREKGPRRIGDLKLPTTEELVAAADNIRNAVEQGMEERKLRKIGEWSDTLDFMVLDTEVPSPPSPELVEIRLQPGEATAAMEGYRQKIKEAEEMRRGKLTLFPQDMNKIRITQQN